MQKEYLSYWEATKYITYALEHFYDISNISLESQVINDKYCFWLKYDYYLNGQKLSLTKELTKKQVLTLIKTGLRLKKHQIIKNLNIELKDNKIRFLKTYFLTDKYLRSKKR